MCKFSFKYDFIIVLLLLTLFYLIFFHYSGFESSFLVFTFNFCFVALIGTFLVFFVWDYFDFKNLSFRYLIICLLSLFIGAYGFASYKQSLFMAELSIKKAEALEYYSGLSPSRSVVYVQKYHLKYFNPDEASKIKDDFFEKMLDYGYVISFETKDYYLFKKQDILRSKNYEK